MNSLVKKIDYKVVACFLENGGQHKLCFICELAIYTCLLADSKIEENLQQKYFLICW